MDLELDLPGDLRDEVQPHHALVLGAVQAVVGAHLAQELEGHQRGDLEERGEGVKPITKRKRELNARQSFLNDQIKIQSLLLISVRKLLL